MHRRVASDKGNPRFVEQELLQRNKYPATVDCILRYQLKGPLRFTDDGRLPQAGIGRRPGRNALEEVARITRPETILAWHRWLSAQ